MIEVKIDMEEGEPLGATPNDKLVITKIQSGTISEGKLRVSAFSRKPQLEFYSGRGSSEKG